VLETSVSWDQVGVAFSLAPQIEGVPAFPASELLLLIRQLEEEGYLEAEDDRLVLRWSDFYRLARSEDAQSIGLLDLPGIDQWSVSLASRGTLTDSDFSVVIAGWIDPEGRKHAGNVDRVGAVVTAGKREAILSEGVWRLAEEISGFWNRPASSRTPDLNRRGWAKIRALAVAANSDLTDFLRKTVVLTPDRLRIDMRKSDIEGARVVEILPQFDGAPERWLEVFDKTSGVPDRYEIPEGNGLVHVVLSPEVRTVLLEVRRMPGRRVAGDRAEAFVRNPFAALGPDAARVIDPDQFERARDSAGISFARFTARVERDSAGTPIAIALLVEETLQGVICSEIKAFEGLAHVEQFLVKLESRMKANAHFCHWDGSDLEILGDTADQARILRLALAEMSKAKKIKPDDLFDVSGYSDRIEGFGVEKPYSSPFIARRNDGTGWFPENVDFGICYTPEGGGETVSVVLDPHNLNALRDEVAGAIESKLETFTFPGSSTPVPVGWAGELVQTLIEAEKGIQAGTFDPRVPSPVKERLDRMGLVVKANVDSLDYEEVHGTLPASGTAPNLPICLLPTIDLKQHQLVGVAWLQNLWRNSPSLCRGGLLADDMGLGKTIQILTFVASVLEEDRKADPFLIVAPLSLLDNWKEEIAKFFNPGAIRVLTLYGPALAQQRVPKRELEDALIGAGITRLLKEGWLGSAQVVLTTYETMRDLEFSLARQKWSAMICDEAQKIKNPNALVTRAAKKQNARLKIACTGTPVENTLTDIWCLFDLVQPGLLGALKEFGERYRRPIEAETEDEKQRVEELRSKIEPQKLRRMKTEVAKDLPKKIEVDSCRALPMSDWQRRLYAEAIAAFRKREKGGLGSGLLSPLGLLQYLRRLCSDPRPPGHLSTDAESVSEIVRRSPKMSWLLDQLRAIESRSEKVIVFCEFRDLQRTLQRAIGERFGFVPDVINGDTTVASSSQTNRQRRIKAFQTKAGFGVIVLSPLAVGFGVNIQAANHVIHFTRTWNPAKEDQATDRAYRIGQEKDVYVYYPVVVANDFVTFDAKLDELLNWKRGLCSDMLNGVGDVSPADFGDLEAPDGGNAFGDELIEPDAIASLDPDSFEAFCAVLWSKQGFSKTIRTSRVGDGGVDVVAIRGKEGVLIQCKSSSIDGRELGWEAVKDVSAGAAAYSAQFPGVRFSKVAVTNCAFNSTARQQANLQHVALVEARDLEVLLGQYPIRRGELTRFLLAAWKRE